jgi:hypothetical protein
MLMVVCWAGMAASVLLTLNIWPRGMLVLCFVYFLSFVSAAQDFSNYQSDGMLLEAGFVALFFAPPGFRPGLGEAHPPSRASVWLLQWEWFRIYFESGVVKLASGDPQWRHFTAMDEYYQNGPLPTWIGWYAQHLPHWFHAGSAFATLALELVLVWMIFLPRRWRVACFAVMTLLQIGIILTANYTFLNYLVLALGVLLLDDRLFAKVFSPGMNVADDETAKRSWTRPLGLSFTALVLSWIFYATLAKMIWIFEPRVPLPVAPVAALEPFRISNQYGLFAVMTRGRYEIEFQGSNNGHEWQAYKFRYKPQDISKPPGIYAPYQPRFDWNLWFASLGSARENPMVLRTEEGLLQGSPDVVALFAENPFSTPPRRVRSVMWQYWFTSLAEKRTTGRWWRRELVGPYAPALEREGDGRITMIQESEEINP